MSKVKVTESVITSLAKAAHSLNKAYCEFIGDYSQPVWELAPDWQKDSAIKGIKFGLESNVTPEESHISWLKEKLDTGWKYGPIKNPELKEHPCIVEYQDLPETEKTKDELFTGIVKSFKTAYTKIYGHTEVESEVDIQIKATKQLRVGLDKQLQELKKLALSKERSIAITKVQEAIMWLGMNLKQLNAPNPYPESYNPKNTIVSPTADGLEL